MNDFERILEFALHWETGGDPNGGYTNDPDDPGGETRWGISKQSYPNLDIFNLQQAGAEIIYFQDFWNGTGRCSAMRWPLSAVHFDCCVNIGNRKIAKDGTVVNHRRANMILQRAVGVEDDGYLGPITMKAIAAADPIEMARKAIQKRNAYYDSLEAWADRYRSGWKARTLALGTFLEL